MTARTPVKSAHGGSLISKCLHLHRDSCKTCACGYGSNPHHVGQSSQICHNSPIAISAIQTHAPRPGSTEPVVRAGDQMCRARLVEGRLVASHHYRTPGSGFPAGPTTHPLALPSRSRSSQQVFEKHHAQRLDESLIRSGKKAGERRASRQSIPP